MSPRANVGQVAYFKNMNQEFKLLKQLIEYHVIFFLVEIKDDTFFLTLWFVFKSKIKFLPFALKCEFFQK